MQLQMLLKQLSVLLALNFMGNAANGERTKDKMYESISGGTACVRRMNGTHQIGCTSNRRGSVGVIHYVATEDDLDFILANGTSPPYIPVVPTALFDNKIAAKLIASAKISGLLLYRENATKVEHFSHDKVCPNDLSNLNSTCAKNWNPYGTGLNFRDFPFPIFFVRTDADVVKIRACFEKFNNFAYDQHNERSLCALEIKAFMFATTDTPTCLRRSNSVLNVNPVKFCDPLAADNVWASLFPIAEVNKTKNEPQKFVVLAARTDTTSLFYELMPGATNPITGIVALLSTAKLLKKMFEGKNDIKYSTNVLFVFFSGESYDYMGSQRFLFDMENGDFPVAAEEAGDLLPQIRPENISLFVEFGQLSHSGGVFAHILENNSEISAFFNKLNYHKNTINLAPSVGILPPASLQTFTKHNHHLPGLVLTDHRDAYVNHFYNSIYDNASNIRFTYYENVTEEDIGVIPADSVQRHIANVSEMVARAVYEEITGDRDVDWARANLPLINELFYCYLENPDCKVHQAIQEKKLLSYPYGFYVGVVSGGRNIVTNHIGLTLAWLTGDIVDPNNDTCADEHSNYLFRYFKMSPTMEDLNTTRCFRTTLNLTKAISPAFIIENYNWSSGEYSSWSESSWQDISVRMFLRPSAAHESMTLAIGAMTFMFAMALVYFVKSRSHILFAPTVVNSPTQC